MSRRGGTLSHVWGGTLSHVPGGTLSQVWGYPTPCLEGTPSQVWGVPHLRSGEYPQTSRPGQGTPLPQTWPGYPPTSDLRLCTYAGGKNVHNILNVPCSKKVGLGINRAKKHLFYASNDREMFCVYLQNDSAFTHNSYHWK